MNPLDSLDRLKSLLARLPGVGRRSAERMAIAAARNRDGYLEQLISTLRQVAAEITACQVCGAMTRTDENPCRLCRDPRRDDRIVCVVEDPADIEVIERSGHFRGRYHAIFGKLVPVRGERPAPERVAALIERIGRDNIAEVILALNSDVESDATAHYLAEKLSGKSVTISRLARGIPAGSGLAYADPVTLEAALKFRTRM